MNKSKTIEYFLQYVSIDTQSDETTGETPSTAKQHTLAELLERQLKEMGAEEIVYDKEHCYLYASVPASPGFDQAPVLGFIAHMDTSPAVTGAGVKPRIVEQYDGEDILLNEEKNIVLSTRDFPEIRKLKGSDLIVTDGTTLLGADDKAGIAEIMAACEYLLTHPECGHGKLRVAFTPDEEIGEGADHFDVRLFGADFAYTVDGGEVGELEDETFNAASARLTIYGRSVHPGSAKGKMLNSILVAQEFQNLLPVFENPMYTEKYEGFFHLDHIEGNVEKTVAEYIIRDHDRRLFEQKKNRFQECAAFLNEKYGVEPVVNPVRGGTDGARLSFMGLPCPNLCTGGANYHSRFEYACVQSMEKVTRLLVGLARVYGDEERWKG